jgi:hypothetical protein
MGGASYNNIGSSALALKNEGRQLVYGVNLKAWGREPKTIVLEGVYGSVFSVWRNPT